MNALNGTGCVVDLYNHRRASGLRPSGRFEHVTMLSEASVYAERVHDSREQLGFMSCSSALLPTTALTATQGLRYDAAASPHRDVSVLRTIHKTRVVSALPRVSEEGQPAATTLSAIPSLGNQWQWRREPSHAKLKAALASTVTSSPYQAPPWCGAASRNARCQRNPSLLRQGQHDGGAEPPPLPALIRRVRTTLIRSEAAPQQHQDGHGYGSSSSGSPPDTSPRRTCTSPGPRQTSTSAGACSTRVAVPTRSSSASLRPTQINAVLESLSMEATSIAKSTVL